MEHAAGDQGGAHLPVAQPALRVDRLPALDQPADRTALARAHPVSSGVLRGSAADRARLLSPLLSPDAERGATRSAAADRPAGMTSARVPVAVLGALAVL